MVSDFLQNQTVATADRSQASIWSWPTRPACWWTSFPPLEDEEIGNAADVVAGGKILVLIRVDFEHDGLPGEVGCGACDFGRGHATWTAPFGPEIDEHGNAGVLENLVEKSGVGGDGLGNRWQRILAGSAAACVG